ncbi:MarR family winged helix-turn-helix transcriptional regulator [Kitasatospora sp. NPDC052896]|uniref:MarR family winged helix-turn-helix transcriptional regulator n=1 Tax=Kitasatospora sp. NPDC052896 TaxID=3364061 RepID=UPI0037CC3DFA
MRNADKHRPDDTDHGTGVEELARAADTLFLAMRRARSAGADQAGELSLAQQSMLEPLALEAGLPVGRLAADAGVSVPTATRMLQQLETKGIVTRRRSPEDERRVLIALTDDGADRLARIRSHRRERQALGYATFSPEERLQLARQLRRLADIIDDLA